MASMFGGLPLDQAEVKPQGGGSMFGGVPLDQPQEIDTRKPQPNEGFWDYQQRQFLGPQSLAGSAVRGLENRMTGIGQLGQDVGKALYGPDVHDPEQQAIYQNMASKLDNEGKGTGVTGLVGEALGDPLNYIPGMGLMKYGAAAGLTSPSSNDTGLGGRATQGVIGAAVMPAVGVASKYLVGKPLQWAANKSGLTDLVASGLQKLGMTGNGSDLYNLAQQAGLDVSGKTPQEIADNLQNWYQTQAQNLATNITPEKYDPVAAARGIAQNWGAAQQATNEAFKSAKEAGANIQQPIEGLPQKLDAMIGALEGNTAPGTKEHAALAQLKYIRQQIGDTTMDVAGGNPVTPKMSGSSLIELRSNLNQAYDPKHLPERGMAPALSATNDVRSALSAAGETNPDFGTKLTAADQAQQQLGQTFKNNDLLGKTDSGFFTVGDLHAFEQNEKNGTPLPDITLQRANQMLDKIKTPEQLNTLTKAMPQKAADSLRAAKVQQLFNDAGFDYKKLADPDFVRLMKQTLGNDPEALKTLDQVQQVAQVLERRGIKPMAPQATQGENNGIGHGIRAAWDLFEGRKAYAVRMAYRALTEEDKAGLTGLQSEIAKGGPLRNALPGAIQQIAPRLLAPQMGNSSVSPSGTGAPTAGQVGLPAQPALPVPPRPESANDDFLAKEAKAESGGNPNAKSKTSSASGLFGFTNRTWNDMVMRYGQQTGIRLSDKNNPQAQATMAKLLAQDNIKELTPILGRMPTKGELYMAHFLGAQGAAKLINANPQQEAIMLFPRQVFDANRNIFFEGKRPRTVGEVYNLLNQKVA